MAEAGPSDQQGIVPEGMETDGADLSESASAPLSRRHLLRAGGKVLVYSAPMVQLFRPSEALAGTGISPAS